MPRVHLIANAHLDPVWQWRWEEGCAEALSTFRTAVDILAEHPRLVFNHNEAVLYRWVEEHDPGLFREIQALVAAGRWCIAGGWFLQPDCNLPGLESLARQIREGRRYFRERFGVVPRVTWNFDSFGHSGGLPQLLRQSGHELYVHMRPQPDELALPSDLYRWRGVDGSEILSLRIAVGLYHTEPFNIEERLRDGVALALRLDRDVPVFWGIGDHGGGATRRDLERIDAFAANEGRVEILHGTPEGLLEALRAAGRTAPIVEGDLQRVFTGTYTSISRLKRRARRSLGGIVQAEALASAAWMEGAPYPASELREAWQDHLFNDFHDILPGSCVESAEEDALDLYGRASESARRVRLGSVVRLLRGLERTAAVPCAVANTNPSLRRVPIVAECMLDLRPRLEGVWHMRVTRPDGTELPSQEEQPECLLPFNGWRRRVAFVDDLPGVGVRLYRLEAVEGSGERSPCRPRVPHAIDPRMGLVTSLGSNGVEMLRGPLFEALVVRDEGDAWGAGITNYREVVGRFEPDGRGSFVVEDGPVRRIVESVFRYGTSRLIVETIAYADWPALEFRFRLSWNEPRRRLKLRVPTALHGARAFSEVPGGIIERAADGEEYVHGRWILLDDPSSSGAGALGIVTSGQHGFDLREGELRLSVLRSAAYCHEKGFPLGERPERRYMDQGYHEFKILVVTGSGEEARRALPGLADWLDSPPFVVSHLPAAMAEGHAIPKSGPDSVEVLSLEPESVRLTAMKRSDDGGGLVVRIQESSGRSAEARVRVGASGPSAVFALRPLEVKTLRLDRGGSWREVDLVGED